VDGKATAWTAVGNFDGVQLWGSGFQLKFDAGWQLASNNKLASASLFQIGGPGSVRRFRRRSTSPLAVWA
jgi:hemolysin activation/secretion protein